MLHYVDAIIFINSSSKRIPNKDLEKHYTTRKIAISEGMATLAEWNRENNKDAKKTFEDQTTWNYFNAIFTKTSVEGFVSATKALYSMPGGEEDITLLLKDSKIKLFGIVGNDDSVFLDLMQDMRKDIPNLEIKRIEGCDHWMIALLFLHCDYGLFCNPRIRSRYMIRYCLMESKYIHSAVLKLHTSSHNRPKTAMHVT